jgi:hypothetical protein
LNWTIVTFFKSFMELCESFDEHNIAANPLPLGSLAKNNTSEKESVRDKRAELIKLLNERGALLNLAQAEKVKRGKRAKFIGVRKHQNKWQV